MFSVFTSGEFNTLLLLFIYLFFHYLVRCLYCILLHLYLYYVWVLFSLKQHGIRIRMIFFSQNRIAESIYHRSMADIRFRHCSTSVCCVCFFYSFFRSVLCSLYLFCSYSRIKHSLHESKIVPFDRRRCRRRHYTTIVSTQALTLHLSFPLHLLHT